MTEQLEQKISKCDSCGQPCEEKYVDGDLPNTLTKLLLCRNVDCPVEHTSMQVEKVCECGSRSFFSDVMDLMGDGVEKDFVKSSLVCSECNIVLAVLDT